MIAPAVTEDRAMQGCNPSAGDGPELAGLGYLSEHAGTRRGIYMVGDFTCDAWADDGDLRRSRGLGGPLRSNSS